MNEVGYSGQNPWNDWANLAEGGNGEVLGEPDKIISMRLVKKKAK